MNVCIVGYGAIAQLHARALSSIEETKIYGICDIDKKRADKGAKDHGAKAYYAYDKVLADKNIDSVHICTPHYLHYSMIVKALDAGKKVVCEKPIVMTEDEWKKLLAHPKSNKVCPILQNRLNQCIKEFKELAESGDFGKICAVKGMLTWLRTPEYYESEEWRGTWDKEGGGVMINQAVHTLDYFSYIGGEVKSVNAIMTNFTLKDVIEVEDTMAIHMEYEDDVRGVFFATNGFSESSDPMFEVTFEKGVIRYEDARLYVNGECIAEDSRGMGAKWYWGTSHEALIRRFYCENKHFTLQEIKPTMDLLFAAYKSAKTGQKIFINQK